MPLLKVDKPDEELVLRLVTGLVRNWDSLPVTLQGLIISEAAKPRDQKVDAAEMRARIFSFITLHKRRGR